MNASAIERACARLEGLWRPCRDAMDGRVDAADAADALAWARCVRDTFVEACGEVTDAADRAELAAHKYIESRCLWSRYNARANYVAAIQDRVDGGAMLRASLMSQVLLVLQDLLEPTVVDRVDTLLTEVTLNGAIPAASLEAT